MKYWLFKTEPNTYSWDDLKSEKNQTTQWEGIRNYQARNILCDEVKNGDLVLFYHSVVKPMAILGVAEVVRESYPDHFALNPESKYYDKKATEDKNPWTMVDIKLKEEFNKPVTRDELKGIEGLEDMMLLKKGSRLSIQPVTEEEFNIITRFAKNK